MTATQRWNAEIFPNLPGRLSVEQAAKILGVNKVTVFHNIYERKLYQHVYKLGDKRPTVVLLEEEVRAVHELAKKKPLHVLQREWRARVMAWAQETGWDKKPLNRTGQVPRLLNEDYLAVFPQDPRPE